MVNCQILDVWQKSSQGVAFDLEGVLTPEIFKDPDLTPRILADR